MARVSTKTDERPRVGPWVGGARFDDRGQEVGCVSIGAAGWRWLANRKYLPPAGNASMTECKTEEEARAAADAVLATWADFEDAPPPDALSQARALLRRARAVLWKMAPRREADVVNGPTWKECDALAPAIDDFLAGLPVTAARAARAWTEEQIRAALEDASGRHHIDADEPITLTCRGMWEALRKGGS